MRRRDLAIAAVLFALAELEVVANGLGPAAAAIAAVATLPLAARRTHPLLAFAAVSVAAPGLDAATGSDWGERANALVFLLLVAAFSLGAHAPLRASAIAVAAAAAWLFALDGFEDGLFLVLVLGIPWAGGAGVRRYRERAARLLALAEQLGEERTARARAAVAEERRRMARDTHGAIAHAVDEMALQAAGAAEVLYAEPERARAALTAVQETGRAAVLELRDVLGDLRADKNVKRSWPAADAVVARPPRPPRVPPALALPALAVALLAYVAFAGAPVTLAGLLLVTFWCASRQDRAAALLAGGLAVGVVALVALVDAGADAVDVLLPAAIVAVPWLSGRLIAADRRVGDELAVLSERLAGERDARARLAVLDERARVARELHDSVAHAVSVMVLQAGAAGAVLDSDPARARTAIATIHDVAREALDQLRTLLGVLEPGDAAPADCAPDLAQLDRLVARVGAAGLPVELATIGTPTPLPPAVDAAAYRVVQEALTNVLKHAGAARTTVTLSYAPDGLRLLVRDDGAPSEPGSGHGLAGMRERVERQGGVFEAGPREDGHGFAVTAFLPATRERVPA